MVHPGFLLDRCTVDAFELKVRVALRARAAAGDRDAKKLDGAAGHLFGLAYERYAEESLRAQLPDLPGSVKRIWSEEELQRVWPGRKQCDFLADYGDALVAIDVVSTRLVEQTYGAGAIEALDEDLRQIVDKKARQIDSTAGLVVDRGHELGLPRVGQPGASVPVFPIVVSTGGLPWNPFIAAVVHARVADAALLSHARVRPLRVVTMQNLEETEALAATGGPSFGRLLVDAHARNQDGFALDQIIDSLGYRLQRPERMNPMWIKRFRELGALLGMEPDALDDLRDPFREHQRATTR